MYFKYILVSLNIKEALIFSHYITHFNTFKEIKSLSLWDSDFRGDIMKYLSEALTNLNHLEIINLYSINKI